MTEIKEGDAVMDQCAEVWGVAEGSAGEEQVVCRLPAGHEGPHRASMPPRFAADLGFKLDKQGRPFAIYPDDH